MAQTTVHLSASQSLETTYTWTRTRAIFGDAKVRITDISLGEALGEVHWQKAILSFELVDTSGTRVGSEVELNKTWGQVGAWYGLGYFDGGIYSVRSKLAIYGDYHFEFYGMQSTGLEWLTTDRTATYQSMRPGQLTSAGTT